MKDKDNRQLELVLQTKVYSVVSGKSVLLFKFLKDRKQIIFSQNSVLAIVYRKIKNVVVIICLFAFFGRGAGGRIIRRKP